MNSNNWAVGKRFTQSTDYVRLSSSDLSAGNTKNNETNSINPDLQYTRSLKGVTVNMPASRYFTATSGYTNNSQDGSLVVKPNRPLLGVGLLKPHHVPVLTTEAKLPADCHVLASTGEPPTKKKRRLKIEKPGPKHGKRILFGSVENFIRWNKVARAANQFFLYEAVGTLEGSTVKGCLQMLILRGDLGQRIQGLYYSIDHTLPPLIAGATYSIVGRVIASKIMMVMDVNEVTPEDKAALPRLAFFCQRALNIAIGNPPDKEL